MNEEIEEQKPIDNEEQLQTTDKQNKYTNVPEVTFQLLKQIVNDIDEDNIDPAKYFEIGKMANTLLNRAKRARRANTSEARNALDTVMLEKTVMAAKKKKENKNILKQLNNLGKQKAIDYKPEEENEEENNDMVEEDEDEGQEPEIYKKIKDSNIADKYKKFLLKNNVNSRKDGAIFHLSKPKRCYCCRELSHKVHHFYHAMCLACGDFNLAKREAPLPDLSNKVAIVTGGRIKIGFLVSLLLLRSGCQVHVTSRFPKDTLDRYKKENDYDSFKERLFIYSLDFRKVSAVVDFCDFFKQKIGKLDYLINNAAQCVKREASYFKYLLDIESKPLKDFSESDLKVLSHDEELKAFEMIKSSDNKSTLNEFNETFLNEDNKNTDNNGNINQQPEAVDTQKQTQPEDERIGQVAKMAYCHFSESVLMNLKPVLEGQKTEKDHLYPQGVVDSNKIQVDLATKNSWNSHIEEVPIFEFMETQVINAWAPFILCQRLKDCMVDTAQDDGKPKDQKFIVNVSSVEGKFHMKNKPTVHPHNNMSKASLNMLTRTVGPQYAKDYNIFMTCVDTGWVSNDMIPQSFLFDNVRRTTPLDELDGALRVVDPIFDAIKGAKPYQTVFLQNYKVVEW